MKIFYTQTNITILLMVYFMAMMVSACGGGNSSSFLALASSQNSSFIFDNNNNIAISNGDNTYKQLPTTGLLPTDKIITTTCGMSACVAVGVNGLLKISSDLSNWKNITPVGSSSSFYNGVINYNNQAVVVGSGGVVVTFDAKTGEDFKTVTSNTNNDLFAIGVSGNNSNYLYVAVGANGTIITSSDGITWTKSDIPTTENLYALTIPNATVAPSKDNPYVVVGSKGVILTSYDGKSWNNVVSGTTNTLLAVQYSSGVFIAAGVNGTILKSSDGVNWSPANTSKATKPNIKDYNIRDVVSQNNGFLAYGVYINASTPATAADEVLFISNDGGSTWYNTAATGSVSTASQGVNSKSISGKTARVTDFFDFVSSVGNFFSDNWKPIVAGVAGVAVGTAQAVFDTNLSDPVTAVVNQITGQDNASVISTVANVTQTAIGVGLKLTQTAAEVAIGVLLNKNLALAKINWDRTNHNSDKINYNYIL